MTGARFTPAEYLGLIAAADRLDQEAAEPGADPQTRADARACARALSKVAGTLTPAQRDEVTRRLVR